LPIGLIELYRNLEDHYDVESWWPKNDAFEVAVGAILTQQTSWNNVLVVLEKMRSEGILSVNCIAEIDLTELEELLRPVGFFRQKSARLKALAVYIQTEYKSDINMFMEKDLQETRQELLRLPGVGPETADSILLFGAKRPVFVAANYCLRILNRLGIIYSKDYEEVRLFVELELGKDADDLAALYALLVEHAKRHCLSNPKCSQCFLSNVCLFTTSKT